MRAEREGYTAFGERKFLACSPAMYAAMAAELLNDHDYLAQLATLDVPTLVVVGEQDTPFLAPSQVMADAIPDAELVVLPDAGHSPQFEAPEAWWDAVSGFLERVRTGTQTTPLDRSPLSVPRLRPLATEGSPSCGGKAGRARHGRGDRLLAVRRSGPRLGNRHRVVTPNYWKNHTDSWAASGYSPSQTVESVFDVPASLAPWVTPPCARRVSFKGGPGSSARRGSCSRRRWPGS